MIICKDYFKPLKLISDPKLAIREIKNVISRAKRGYGRVDTYDLGYYFLEVFSEAIKEFKEVTISYPPDLTPEEWDKILQDIVDGFNAMKEQYYEWGDEKEFKEAQKKYEKAMKLFCEWHRNLWW